MSVESAEMTKHALNAFLATSVTFINEIAALCEQVGADATEVERGLKSEARIGPKAYLSPGGAFAGGTLARDVVFLSQLGRDARRRDAPAVRRSRPATTRTGSGRSGASPQLLAVSPAETVAVWGLTYKPGTDTLRRSSAVELCRGCASRARACARTTRRCRRCPPDLARRIELALDAARRGRAARRRSSSRRRGRSTVRVDAGAGRRAHGAAPLVLDANRFLGGDARRASRGLEYVDASGRRRA